MTQRHKLYDLHQKRPAVQREYDAAIESYSKAIALAPNYAEPHINLGNAFENQGNLQAAVKSYTQALVYQPENEVTQNNLIRARQQLGGPDSAKDRTDRP